VHGTVALAKQMHTPSLQRFLHVSTAFLFDKHAITPTTNRNVRERDFPDGTASHYVEYTRTKAEAEWRLASDVGAGFPLLIARPSIVVGHSTLGCQPSGSIFWAFRACERLGILPSRAKIDVVPVDYVAKVLCGLLFSPTHRPVYHISAGKNSNSIEDIFNAIASSSHLKAQNYSVGSMADVTAQAKQFSALFGGDLDHPCKIRWILRALTNYMYFASMGVTFDNSQLLEEGYPQPPPFVSYIPKCTAMPPIDIGSQFFDDVGMVKH